MTAFDTIAFDADDTLWYYEQLYTQAQAVYVPGEIAWAHEAVETPPSEQPGFYQLESVRSLPVLLKQIECE